MPPGDNDEANRTAQGRAPAPYGTEDTLAAPPSQAPAGVEGSQSSAADEPVADDSLPLPVLDRTRYEVIGEVGRGGLGRVIRVRDVALDREVAIKELIHTNEGDQRRFVREALITARLQHPAIVPIYDAGQSGEHGPFYSMKLVAGRSLADALAQAPTLDQRLALLPSVIAVVDAMAYAHSQKIIHRDLKPQNVLVGDFGETVLIDWGLAKDLRIHESRPVGPYRAASASTQTMDGAVMGTPAFMAPEQAHGEEVDERADVYALGAILYQLAAGTPPRGGKSIDEVLVQVVRGDVVPLPEREPRVPADLAAIVAKAMQHEPAKRYATARELSDDLHKFQTGKLVGAKTYTRGERLARWVRKNRRVLAVVTAALAILLLYGGWSVSKIYAERQRAEDEAARAVAAARDAATQRDLAVAQAMLVRARQYAATGHTAEELAVLRVLARPDAGADARKLAIDEGGLIWKAHQRLAIAIGHDVGLAMRSADGTKLVATEPGAIVVWDVGSGRELVRMPLDASPTAARFGKIAAFSPTGRYAVVAVCAQSTASCGFTMLGDAAFAPSANARLELRELATKQVLATWTTAEPLGRGSLAFAVDDSAVAIRHGGKLELVDAHGARRELDAAGCTGTLAIAPDAAAVAIGCKDHVHLVRGDTATVILRPSPGTVQLHFVSADRLVAIADTVKLWDVARGELRGEGKLPTTDEDADGDEVEDIDWTYVRPGPAGKTASATKIPQIRIASATSIVPRTSVLAPPPRLTATGAIVTLEGQDWQALWLDRDRVRYALVDHLVPMQPPDRCLSRIGAERHATIALDGGTRLLVDEQELAAGLETAPPEGYRHATTAETPVRQLRPLVSAESDACLAWGDALGAHAIDAGAVPVARAYLVDGNLVLVGDEVLRIARDGKHTPVALPAGFDPPVESPRGDHVAAYDPIADVVVIVAAATGREVRRFTLPPRASHAAQPLRWFGDGMLAVDAGDTYLVPVDPAREPRKAVAGLVGDPRSAYATLLPGGGVAVVKLATDEVIARYPGAFSSARPLPDASGRIVVEQAGKRFVIANGRQIPLAATRLADLGTLEVVDDHLIARSRDDVAVWNLATGAAIPVTIGAHDVAIRGGELWTITGTRKPRLIRASLAGAGARETALSTAGLPFHHPTKHLTISPDGKRVTIEYAVTEELTAIATWDADTGRLLWVGPPSARVVGDWVLAGGHAYVPSFDIDALLRDTGARTNLRVCESDLRAVPVVPPPPPDTYWAPASACAPVTTK
ncbi:MAG TPA: serine/threonine-protein kinase [Kofleriaceae bacterium]|nr:serine/threonine-protein kinase [Kofleriaceae bacterium]